MGRKRTKPIKVRVRCSGLSEKTEERCGKILLADSLTDVVYCKYHQDMTKQNRLKITEMCVHVKSNGEPCKMHSIRGSSVCYFHGGRYKQIKAKAAKRVRKLEAIKQMALLGLPVDGIDPYEALLEDIARTAGHVRWLQAKVQGMEEEDLVWGRTAEETSEGEHQTSNYHIVGKCYNGICAGNTERLGEGS